MIGACAAVGCGGDDGHGPDAEVPERDAARLDAPQRSPCWDQALAPPCCYSHSNADRLDHPQLKFVDLDATHPIAFTEPSTAYGFTQSLRIGALDFAFGIEGATGEGPITVTFGSLIRQDEGGDAYYRWANGDAPAPDDPNRWDPQTATGTIVGDRISSDSLVEDLIAPIHDTDGTTPLELHLSRIALVDVELTDQRTCVGAFDPSGLGRVIGTGRVTFFVRVELSRVGRFPVIGVSACELFSGGSCEGPQESWTYPPDSVCDAGGCRMGECTPDTCDAWYFDATIGAAGVEIR